MRLADGRKINGRREGSRQGEMFQPLNADRGEDVGPVLPPRPEKQVGELRQSPDCLRMMNLLHPVDRKAADFIQVVEHRCVEPNLEMIEEANCQAIAKLGACPLDQVQINTSADNLVDDFLDATSAVFEMPDRNAFGNRPMNLQSLNCSFTLRV